MRLLRQFLRLKIPFEQHYVPNVTAEICQPVSASKDSFFVFQEIDIYYKSSTLWWLSVYLNSFAAGLIKQYKTILNQTHLWRWRKYRAKSILTPPPPFLRSCFASTVKTHTAVYTVLNTNSQITMEWINRFTTFANK